VFAPHGVRRSTHPLTRPAFECSLQRGADGVVLTLRGDLDLASAPELGKAASAAIETGCDRLVVDLRELSFMDSSGLRAFLRLQAEAGDAVRLEFIPGPPQVQRVFELAGLASALPFRA
jgi:anti-sigma B factor antagonist